jgi:integrase
MKTIKPISLFDAMIMDGPPPRTDLVVRHADVRTITTRGGRLRHFYVPPRGGKRVEMHAEYGSPAFDRALKALRAGKAPKTAEPERFPVGTVDAVLVTYYTSTKFRNLRASTQRLYRHHLEPFREEFGDRHMKSFRADDIELIMARMEKAPHAANKRRAVLRLLFRFAAKHGWCRDNPTRLVDPIKTNSDGHRAWGADDIARYRARHEVGSKARLAMELAYHTGQRLGDVSKMGGHSLTGTVLKIVQGKTGVPVEHDVSPELLAIIKATPSASVGATFLINEWDGPYTASVLCRRVREWVAQAGLSGLTLHGLRATAATELVNNGGSDRQTMAFCGWSPPSMVSTYVRRADKVKLANAGQAIRFGLSHEANPLSSEAKPLSSQGERMVSSTLHGS